MTQPGTMYYLDGPVGDGPSSASGQKPLNIATVSTQYFGKKAWEYNNIEGDAHKEAKWKAEYSAMEQALANESGTLLDVACGTGRFFPIYQALGIAATGMDVSGDMLHQARVDYPWAKFEQEDFRTFNCRVRQYGIVVSTQFVKFADPQELPQLLGKLCDIADRKVIVSLHTGEKLERRSRAWIHPLSAFTQIMQSKGFTLKARADIEAPFHHLWVCERT